MEQTKIGLEELEVLEEIESMCIFHSVEEKRSFRKEVCGYENFQNVSEDDFEKVFYSAKAILQKRGEQVFLDMIKKA